MPQTACLPLEAGGPPSPVGVGLGAPKSQGKGVLYNMVTVGDATPSSRKLRFSMSQAVWLKPWTEAQILATGGTWRQGVGGKESKSGHLCLPLLPFAPGQSSTRSFALCNTPPPLKRPLVCHPLPFAQPSLSTTHLLTADHQPALLAGSPSSSWPRHLHAEGAQ